MFDNLPNPAILGQFLAHRPMLPGCNLEELQHIFFANHFSFFFAKITRSCHSIAAGQKMAPLNNAWGLETCMPKEPEPNPKSIKLGPADSDLASNSASLTAPVLVVPPCQQNCPGSAYFKLRRTPRQPAAYIARPMQPRPRACTAQATRRAYFSPIDAAALTSLESTSCHVCVR